MLRHIKIHSIIVGDPSPSISNLTLFKNGRLGLNVTVKASKTIHMKNVRKVHDIKVRRTKCAKLIILYHIKRTRLLHFAGGIANENALRKMDATHAYFRSQTYSDDTFSIVLGAFYEKGECISATLVKHGFVITNQNLYNRQKSKTLPSTGKVIQSGYWGPKGILLIVFLGKSKTITEISF